MGGWGGGKMIFSNQITLLPLAGLQLLPSSHKVFAVTNTPFKLQAYESLLFELFLYTKDFDSYPHCN